jgi:hypothetical protein
MLVTLSHPNGVTEEVVLAHVPRVGDSIRLQNGPDSPSLIVESVTWFQGKAGNPEATVMLQVRKRTD